MILTARSFSWRRHTTHYWEAGPVDGPLMIFLHGWPEIGLMWRAQIEAFASEGWRCIAPDMRGYGGSSAPAAPEAYRLNEIFDDLVELHDHLGARPAIWVGHDWGSPVAGALAAHHGPRSRAAALISVPYFPKSFALPKSSAPDRPPALSRRPISGWTVGLFSLLPDPLRPDGQ
jgi:pimeloyl-ACP methyl ester carboxylesterase